MDEEIEDPEEDVTIEDTRNEVLQEEVIAVTAREATPEEVQVVTSRESTPEVIILQTSLNSSTNCVECNEEFESSRSYRFHMRVHHIKTEDDPIQIKTETEQEEKVVIKIKQEQKKFHTCDICQKSFVAVISLNAHKKIRHKIEVDKEEDVQVVHDVQEVVEVQDVPDDQVITKPLHRPSKKLKNIQHECEVCDVVLFRKDYLLNHIKIVHPGEYICQFCKRVNHSYVDMIHHMTTNHKNKVFTENNLHSCQKCYVKFAVKDHLKIHMLEKHVKKPFVSKLHCAPCKATYPCDRLSRHKKHITHIQLTKIEERLKHGFNAQKNIKHKTVKVKFIPQRRNSVINQSKYYMKYFVNQGSLFNCEICNATFGIRKQLIQHLKTHPEIPTFDCSICPLKFFVKHKYDLHLKTHNDDGPEKSKYSCKICLNLFSTEKNFMIHVNVRHNATDNPNFICGVCGNGHGNEDELIRHFKTHNGNNQAQVVVKEDTDEERSDNDSPYCKICKLSFKFKIIQNIHNNMWHNESNPNRNLTHLAQESLKKEQETDIKFIKCELCDEPFIRPDDLEEHLKTKHLDQDSSGEDKPLIIDETTPNTSKTDFNCDQCILNFPCEQYLTNHKRFFCKSSPKVIINVSENQNTLNEQ